MAQSAADTGRQSSLAEALDRARQLIRAGNPAEADKLCRQLLVATPDHPDILHVLGTIALQNGHPARAIVLLERAALDPGASPEIYGFLCQLYRGEGRMEEALAAGREALKRRGHSPRSAFNLAAVHMDSKEFDEATNCLLHALALDPDFAPARLELGHLLLRKGEFNAGWMEYEWRFRLDNGRDVLPKINAPRWNGMRLPQGRILLIGDQGYGDTIQFARYIPQVAERVRDVVVGCSHELLPLISTVPGIMDCFVRWEDIPGFSVFCPLSSLPGVFETKPDTIPAAVPYLKVPPAKLAHWSARLAAAVGDRALRVGVAWAGRPSHPNDRQRTLQWAQLLPLTRIPGVTLISLQKEIPAADRAAVPTGIAALDLTAELEDFADTAAVIENLDLVVTIDSSAAHLAGALGRPVWVMLPWVPDWRWMLDREDSAWYPTMRLFRQPSRGDWTSAIARVARELEVLASERGHAPLAVAGGANPAIANLRTPV